MADFTNVAVAQDPASLAVALSGAARGPVKSPVHINATVGAGDDEETLELDGSVSRLADLDTRLLSVTDDQGGTWTVSEDGRSATPPTS